jgi:hypothetical protein
MPYICEIKKEDLINSFVVERNIGNYRKLIFSVSISYNGMIDSLIIFMFD